MASLRPALERDRGLGVAYSGVKYIDKDSKDTGLNDNRVFSWEIQAKGGVPPSTCIPSGSMFRKSMWERCGGYRQKYAPGEDTEFWVRGLSLGFTAELVTEECHFWYRGHSGSASRTKVYVPIDDNKPWMRDKKYPAFAPSFYPPAVHSYLNPVVSVIIPVGPGHETLVEDAIESVIGQTVQGMGIDPGRGYVSLRDERIWRCPAETVSFRKVILYEGDRRGWGSAEHRDRTRQREIHSVSGRGRLAEK